MMDNESMKFFYQIFDASLPRLGPGDDTSTRKALDMLFAVAPRDGDTPFPSKLRVLDIGCGNGAQTIALARLIDGTILAVDNHQPYLDELQRRAQVAGVSNKIRPCLKDMHDLGLPAGSQDLIWSEGALYSMGFAEGLAACHALLAPGGLLAASELCWLRSDRPAECRQFFAEEYPQMVDIDTNLARIKETGFQIVGHFTVPESSWWDPYYHPLADRLQVLRKEWATSTKKLDLIDSIEREIHIYRKYSACYGNVFFLMQRSQ